jgi:Phage portal protein
VAFVVAEGQLAATDRPAGQAPYALRLPDGSAQDYATIWRTQPQVRTVVSFLARNIVQLGVHHFRRLSDVDRQRLTDTPVAQLLGRPNPFTTRFRMFDSLVSDLGIYDAAYWAKVRASDTEAPGALVRLDPRRTLPVGDNPFTPDGFEVSGSKGKRGPGVGSVTVGRGPERLLWGCKQPTDDRGRDEQNATISADLSGGKA